MAAPCNGLNEARHCRPARCLAGQSSAYGFIIALSTTFWGGFQSLTFTFTIMVGLSMGLSMDLSADLSAVLGQITR